MHRSDSRFEPTPIEQAPLMGVISVMFLLIPCLVLMAQLGRLTEIDVSPPQFTAAADDHRTHCGPTTPQLHVIIARDGFYTRLGYDEWTPVGSSRALYDHDALTEIVREYKRDYPHEVVATVSAENDVPYHEVVATLDTLRGRDCRLAGALAGEEVPQTCLLWSPIIEAPTQNELPRARS